MAQNIFCPELFSGFLKAKYLCVSCVVASFRFSFSLWALAIIFPSKTAIAPMGISVVSSDLSASFRADRGRFYTGLQFALRATKISPQNGDSWLALGEIQSEMNDKLEAEKSYLRSIDAGFLIDEGIFNSLPHLRLGELFYETSRITDARYEFREAVRQYPALYDILITDPEYSSLLKSPG